MFVLPKIFKFRLGISNLSVGIFLVGLKRILLHVVFKSILHLSKTFLSKNGILFEQIII